jgi:hypothetical protein
MAFLSRGLFLLVFTVGVFGSLQADELGERSAYDIPLVRLKIGDDEDGGDEFKEIRVTLKEGKEYAEITRYSDLHIKVVRNGREKTVHSEPPDLAFMLSDFEAESLDRPTLSLIKTLEDFERDLKRGRWDRCLYLDSFLPRFLRAYYFLVCAARNSTHALPEIARIPERAFDVSLSSPKSDKRINAWRSSPNYVIKLRIITKELIHQLKEWRKKELDNSRRNPEISYSSKVEEAYGLFIKIYFNHSFN